MSNRATIKLLAFLPLVFSLTACTTNVATGRSQFNMLSQDEEIRLGEQAAAQVLSESNKIPSPEIQQYLDWVGQRIAQHVEPEYRDLPWEFTGIDDPSVNAFALPGGKIFIYRGLLERMDNEAQLAGVLAHEIGHVVGEHADDRIARAQGISLGAAVLGAAVGVAASDEELVSLVVGGASYGGSLYLLSFSRDQEAESDELGLRYMTRAGYNPEGMRQVMEILDKASDRGGIEFFQTHPHPETRIRTIDDFLDREYAVHADLPFHADRFEQEMGSRLRQN